MDDNRRRKREEEEGGNSEDVEQENENVEGCDEEDAMNKRKTQQNERVHEENQ